MTITDWPVNERPREKLITAGAATLSDAELLAIFLRVGIKGKTAVDLARDLINEYGSLRNLLTISHAKFCEISGLGTAKYAQLQAALEIGRRYLQETLIRDDVLKNPTTTRQYLTAKLRHYQREVFACLYLDNRHRVISFDELFFGSVDNATVYPREIVKRALEHNAAAVIFAHNHPSGIAEPSQADRSLTAQLIKALETVQIRVLDHIIIGEAEVVSLAEKGWL